jgi:CRP-like cAMP-binding protein
MLSFGRYFIESGYFSVVKNETTVGKCGYGDIFGELALMYNAKRTATITSTTKGKLWALDRQTLR